MEAMENGRGFVEAKNVWRKLCGYGELGDESLMEVRSSFNRESLASWRRNLIGNLINVEKIMQHFIMENQAYNRGLYTSYL